MPVSVREKGELAVSITIPADRPTTGRLKEPTDTTPIDPVARFAPQVAVCPENDTSAAQLTVVRRHLQFPQGLGGK